MRTDSIGRGRPRRHEWDRRRDLGRRMVRDRRREAILVPFERRGADRRSGSQRRSDAERRTSPPEGFHSLDP